MPLFHRPAFYTIIALGVSGCALHSVDSSPQPSIQATSSYSMQTGGDVKTFHRWYESFGDIRLTSLIETAQNTNLDKLQALARIEQAKAFRIQAISSRLPSIEGEGDASKDWDDGQEQDSLRSIGASVSWEIDVFNRLGAEQNAREYELQASTDDLEAITLSLSAELARNYYGAIAKQRQLDLLHAQIKSDQHLLELVSQRLKAGVGTNVEVLQQQSQLADNQSLIPLEEASLRVYENRMDVLLAQAPDAKNRTTLQDTFPIISELPETGVPSDLLLNRPDLRALKKRLIAQDAEIAAAMAERLPKINLSGSLMFYEGATAVSPVASVLGGLIQPLLDWGRRKAEVGRNKALYEEKLATFTQAYLVAIEEVENALYQENRQREYLKRLEIQRDLLLQTSETARAVYEQGESDYLPVIDAVKNLRSVERTIVQEQLDLILLRIQLFKALGGSTEYSKETQ